MRITIELPDELVEKARLQASASGITLAELFISALECRLSTPTKVRRDPTTIDAPANLHLLSREQLDEAMFG